MVRIGVFTGKSTYKGLPLLDFEVLGDLESSSMNDGVEKFSLVARYLEFNERMKTNRIYMVNILDDEDITKPIRHYTILDKAKFVKYIDNDYIITYKRYSGLSLIDLYENRTEETQEYIDFCLERGKVSPKLHFNTFTKNILETIFENYGYSDVIRYDSKYELKNWRREILEKMKNTYKVEEKSSDWSELEWEYLLLNLEMSEKELAKRLGRTVASIASKKWKIKAKYNNNLKDITMSRKALIKKKIKEYRELKDISQPELSKESGISHSVINQLECENYNNTETPTVKKLLDHIEKNTNIIVSDLTPEEEKEVKRKKVGRKSSGLKGERPKRKSTVATNKAKPKPEVELSVVSESKSEPVQKEKVDVPESNRPNISDVLNEVKDLRETINKLMKQLINLNIENSVLKKEKKEVMGMLTNKMAEGVS